MKQFADVNCHYGAPMGRRNRVDVDILATQALRCVRMKLVDYAYDQGGAYWGGPANLWVVSSALSDQHLDDGNCFWTVRAASRERAKSLFEDEYAPVSWRN